MHWHIQKKRNSTQCSISFRISRRGRGPTTWAWLWPDYGLREWLVSRFSFTLNKYCTIVLSECARAKGKAIQMSSQLPSQRVGNCCTKICPLLWRPGRAGPRIILQKHSTSPATQPPNHSATHIRHPSRVNMPKKQNRESESKRENKKKK